MLTKEEITSADLLHRTDIVYYEYNIIYEKDSYVACIDKSYRGIIIITIPDFPKKNRCLTRAGNIFASYDRRCQMAAVVK